MYGWLWTFRVAGFGLIIAVIILLATWKTLAHADRTPERDEEDTGFGAVFFQILLPAILVGTVGYFLARHYLPPSIPLRPAVCGFLAGMVPVIIYFVQLGVTARDEERPGLLALLPIYVAGGAFFMILHLNGSAMTQSARDDTDRQIEGSNRFIRVLNPWAEQEALPNYYVNANESTPRPDPRSLLVVDPYLPPESLSADVVARMYGQQRMDADIVDTLAKTMHDGVRVEQYPNQDAVPAQWAARACRVYPDGLVRIETGVDSHGHPTTTVEVPDGARPIGSVVFLRDMDDHTIATYLTDQQTFDSVYELYRKRYGREPPTLPPGEFLAVVNPEVYQSWNAIFVVLLTPVVVAFFMWRVNINKGIPTARKLLYGMLMTALALLVMAMAGKLSDDGTSKVSPVWLASFYGIVTLGELCLSPMGLSLVTKLSPKRLVGLTMGGWFLATAFGNNLSGFFGSIQDTMTPVGFFLLLSGLAASVALFILVLLPKLDSTIRRYGA